MTKEMSEYGFLRLALSYRVLGLNKGWSSVQQQNVTGEWSLPVLADRTLHVLLIHWQYLAFVGALTFF